MRALVSVGGGRGRLRDQTDEQLETSSSTPGALPAGRFRGEALARLSGFSARNSFLVLR